MCPGAGPRATAAVVARFREARALDDALANSLRRAAATAVLHEPERVDPVEAQRAILADRRRFRAALDRDDAAIVVVAEVLGEVLSPLPVAGGGRKPGPTAGAVHLGARLAPATLEAFRVQVRDVFPREDMGGVALALGVIDALLPAVDVHRRVGLEAERARLAARVRPERGAPIERTAAPNDGQGWLAEADRRAADADWSAVGAALANARRAFETAGDLSGLAAVLRRDASLAALAGEGVDTREALLREAARLARAAGDRAGETEALEDLSALYAEHARERDAVAVLGAIARRAREDVDAAGEARALQLAGRLLCEAPHGRDDPGRGLVVLLFAADLAASVDPVVADLIRRYITGFQYTLSDAQFAAIEPMLDRDREAVVAELFAARVFEP